VRYLIRRLVHAVLVLAGVSVLSFLFLQLAPGDYLSDMRLDPRISPETVAALREQHGLDRPLPVKYGRWLVSAAHGDFGFSFAYNSAAGPLLWTRARNTLLLTGTATAASWLIAVPLGLWLAAWRGGWTDRAGTAVLSGLLAIPDLLLALALLMFAVRTRRLPAGGGWEHASDIPAHLLLPACALVLGALPVLVRHVRAAAAEVLEAPFIRAARAHGIPAVRLMWRHVLPAAANPLISLFGFSVGTLLSASLLIEVVMGWPGLGPLLVEAILARDLFVVIDGVLFSAALLIAGNLLADVLLYVADPRIRTS
jgi:peptide/nickel transport system permease protein